MSISIKQALAEAGDLGARSESRQLDGELLLAAALGQSREYLHTWPGNAVDAPALSRYRGYLQRRRRGEPVAYILGRKPFRDFELRVNSHVLIPRPETEQLVELALERARSMQAREQEPLAIADLGTGSGAIAIAMARANTNWRVSAVDISADALAVARGNAADLGVDNIEFSVGCWCDGLTQPEYDMIIANPPYVAPESDYLQGGDLAFEPTIALVAAESGLADLTSIIRQSRDYLKKDAWLLLEHGFDQQRTLIQRLQEAGFANVEGRRDYGGIDRMVAARWPV